MLKIYNTLTKQKEIFDPINPKSIGIYVCGMTVYDYCHIGHARVLVMFDVIVRHLRRNFLKVKYVRNITDIDDKIIQAAIKNKEDIYSLTNRFINIMHQDEQALGIISPNIEPRATQSIAQMLALIQKLIDKGLAYKGSGGDIYYAVRNFKNYGKLSGEKLDELKAGARVDLKNDKKDPLDFTLWKMAKPDEPSWKSPWGYGRPGWHIECSAMATRYLGNSFDIHGGGADLIFPHHENEIAQSEGANNCNFANTWIHIGFVNIDNEKMSKSLNNFHTINAVLKNYTGEVLRYFIISSHYRSQLNFSYKNLAEAKASLTRLYTATRGLKTTDKLTTPCAYTERFDKALDDDFNTPIALSILFELAKQINSIRNMNIKKARALSCLLKKLGTYMGILQTDTEEFLQQDATLSIVEINHKIKLRNTARAHKDFTLADKIRDELIKANIILEDKENSTTWRKQ